MTIRTVYRETLKVCGKLPLFWWVIFLLASVASALDSELSEGVKDWQRLLAYGAPAGIFLLWAEAWLVLSTVQILDRHPVLIRPMNWQAASRVIPMFVFYLILGAWLSLAALPGILLTLIPSIFLSKVVTNTKILLVLAPVWIAPVVLYVFTVFFLTVPIVAIFGWDTPNPFSESRRLIRPRFWIFFKITLIWGVVAGGLAAFDFVLPGSGTVKLGLRFADAVLASLNWMFYTVLSVIAYRRLIAKD